MFCFAEPEVAVYHSYQDQPFSYPCTPQNYSTGSPFLPSQSPMMHQGMPPAYQQPPQAQPASAPQQQPQQQQIHQRTSPAYQAPPQPPHPLSLDPAKGGYTLNYENIQVVELIKFISQIANKNFVFNCNDLNFCITFVSDEPTNVEHLMTSLMQILRTNGFNMSEEGNNIVIYKQGSPISLVSPIVTDENATQYSTAAVITRVFRVYNLAPDRLAQIIAPLLSKEALVEVSMETRHLIVTDLTSNVDKIADLLTSIDVPNAAMDVGQYAVHSSYPQSLINIAYQILRPLAQDNILNMVVQPSSGTIFIVSTPYLIQRAIAVLQSLDSETVLSDVVDLPPQDFANTNFYVYKLRYHEGEEIAQSLRDIGANLQRTGLANMDLVSAIQSMQWIVSNNTLVFSGTDAAIEKIKRLLLDLDRPPKQVFIEMLIIDTTISNSLDFGVEWIALGNQLGKAAIGTGFLDVTGDAFHQGARSALGCPPPNAARPGPAFTSSGPQPGPTTFCPGGYGGGDVPLTTGFGIGVIGDIITHGGKSFLTLGALLHALEAEGDTKIVINPRILTDDTKEANVFVGQNIPYSTTSVVQKDTGTVTSNLQYEDIGVQLRVTPYIAANNVVTLDIDQSISEIIFLDVEPANVSLIAPTTTKILTTTRVHIPDRAFLVLSGLMRDQQIFTWKGIPCLGSLPCIGPLFSTSLESRQKRNLILFIRPVILDTSQEGIDLTNEQGCQYNWESSPCSIIEYGPAKAPECEAIINYHNHPPER